VAGHIGFELRCAERKFISLNIRQCSDLHWRAPVASAAGSWRPQSTPAPRSIPRLSRRAGSTRPVGQDTKQREGVADDAARHVGGSPFLAKCSRLAGPTLAVPGAHAIVILDKAGLHATRKLKVPKNLTMVPLPPACPELNAAENIWQYLRQTYLSNRVFKSYTDILDACQDAWRKLLDETGRIASIATRQWFFARSIGCADDFLAWQALARRGAGRGARSWDFSGPRGAANKGS
jgi:transposase